MSIALHDHLSLSNASVRTAATSPLAALPSIDVIAQHYVTCAVFAGQSDRPNNGVVQTGGFEMFIGFMFGLKVMRKLALRVGIICTSAAEHNKTGNLGLRGKIDKPFGAITSTLSVISGPLSPPEPAANLRLIEDELWQAARRRQGATTSKASGVPVWDRRRPRFPFSGLMRRGCCGGGFSMVAQESFGCSTALNKGRAACINMRLIRRRDLEARVLDALQHHLMDPEAVRIFCEEYAAERDRLRAATDAGRSALEAELRRDHARLVDAIVAGIPADQVRDGMIGLETRRVEIEVLLQAAPAADPVRFHPTMAATYRERVGALIRELTAPSGMEEAKEALRTLVEAIVLTPDPTGAGLQIDLHGALASLLRLATGQPVAEPQRQTQKRPRREHGGV